MYRDNMDSEKNYTKEKTEVWVYVPLANNNKFFLEIAFDV